ncbi:MAG: IucA/IucC family protein, partial [Thiohalorhabdaceae bacterium]
VLSGAMARDYRLVPVHPRLWETDLDHRLAEAGLAHRVQWAPRPWLTVTPTLSVRTVAPLAHPGQHLKLPLPLRTLGARNRRT